MTSDWRDIIAGRKLRRRLRPPSKRGVHPHTCLQCQAVFSSHRREQKFCSKRCGDASSRAQRRSERRKARLAILEARRLALPVGQFEERRRRLAAHLARVRPSGPGSIGPRPLAFTITCKGCGEPFQSAYRNALWHSATCRKRYQRRQAHAPIEGLAPRGDPRRL